MEAQDRLQMLLLSQPPGLTPPLTGSPSAVAAFPLSDPLGCTFAYVSCTASSFLPRTGSHELSHDPPLR